MSKKKTIIVVHSYEKLIERLSLIDFYFIEKNQKINFLKDFIENWNNPLISLNSYRKIDKIKEDKIMLQLKWAIWKYSIKYFQDNLLEKEICFNTIFVKAFKDVSILKELEEKIIRREI